MASAVPEGCCIAFLGALPVVLPHIWSLVEKVHASKLRPMTLRWYFRVCIRGNMKIYTSLFYRGWSWFDVSIPSFIMFCFLSRFIWGHFSEIALPAVSTVQVYIHLKSYFHSHSLRWWYENHTFLMGSDQSSLLGVICFLLCFFSALVMYICFLFHIYL